MKKKIKKLNKDFHFHDFPTGKIDEDGEMIYEIKKCYADCPKLIIEFESNLKTK